MIVSVWPDSFAGPLRSLARSEAKGRRSSTTRRASRASASAAAWSCSRSAWPREDSRSGEIESATKQKIALDAIQLRGLGQWEQVFTYALASWFASLDGIASTDEREVLAQLGDALGLDKPLRVRAAAAANDIACLPEGGRPDRYDFVKLAARLRERLPQIQ